MVRTLTPVAAAALLLFSAACNDGTIAPSGSSQELPAQLADVALDSDVITERMVNDELAAMESARSRVRSTARKTSPPA